MSLSLVLFWLFGIEAVCAHGQFCNYALQLETDPQLRDHGSIFTANASSFRKLGISPDTSAAANLGWFLGDAVSRVGPNGEPLCACAHVLNGRCVWSNGSRAFVNCSLDYWADTPYETISKVEKMSFSLLWALNLTHIV